MPLLEMPPFAELRPRIVENLAKVLTTFLQGVGAGRKSDPQCQHKYARHVVIITIGTIIIIIIFTIDTL